MGEEKCTTNISRRFAGSLELSGGQVIEGISYALKLPLNPQLSAKSISSSYQRRSHGMLAWCTGTRVKPTFTTKFTNIYRISQERFICYLMGAPPQFLC